MSIRVMSQVWEHSLAEGGELLVLLALADFADDDGYCWPSIARLAGKSRLSERQVKRVLRTLAERDEIEMPTGERSAERPFRVTPVTPGQNVPGDAHDTPGVTPMTPPGGTPTRARVEPSDVEPSKEPPERTREQRPDPVREVWDHFIARIPSRRRLDATARRQIAAALKVRSIDEVKAAIDGLATSPHHRGINDRNKPYLELRYAIVPRNGESIEERIEKAIGWGRQNGENRMDPDKVSRLLEAARYTWSLPHKPERARGEAARAALEKAGFRVEEVEGPPYLRIVR